jgi:hypothetical protein
MLCDGVGLQLAVLLCPGAEGYGAAAKGPDVHWFALMPKNQCAPTAL